jgi:HPt (histidine-containing phosphotransfer) domain-containing protein
MAFENGEFDAALAAAAGDDPALQLELRRAFLESADRQLDLLRRSRCDANWEQAATRMKGLAATFHAAALQDLAEDALVAAPGEPTILREMEGFLGELRGTDAS